MNTDTTVTTGKTRCYMGPGAVVVTKAEAEELLELLQANPREWNANLRRKIKRYLGIPEPEGVKSQV